MSTNTTPRKALNKAYLKQVPFAARYFGLCPTWQGVLQQLKPEETEEFRKKIVEPDTATKEQLNTLVAHTIATGEEDGIDEVVWGLYGVEKFDV